MTGNRLIEAARGRDGAGWAVHDHVTVGAGSCGAALAARLSGDPGTSVLLLGAGSDYRSADAPPAMQLLNPFASLDDPTHGRFSDEGLVARRSVAEEPWHCDPECRVVGVEGLSVVDASIMPAMVGADTRLTAVMIGEHATARLRAGGRPSS